MKLTDYVTAQMIEDWIKWQAENIGDPMETATTVFDHMTPELIALSKTMQRWFGVKSREIGPILQYLDEAIRFNSEEK